MKSIENRIFEGSTLLHGKGKTFKGSHYEIHEVDDSYYAVIIEDQNSLILDIKEISYEEIKDYI